MYANIKLNNSSVLDLYTKEVTIANIVFSIRKKKVIQELRNSSSHSKYLPDKITKKFIRIHIPSSTLDSVLKFFLSSHTHTKYIMNQILNHIISFHIAHKLSNWSFNIYNVAKNINIHQIFAITFSEKNKANFEGSDMISFFSIIFEVSGISLVVSSSISNSLSVGNEYFHSLFVLFLICSFVLVWGKFSILISFFVQVS